MNGILELESAPRFAAAATHEDDMKDLMERLKSFQQEHLLQFWDVLTEEQRGDFAASLKGIDFAHVAHMFQQTREESSQQAAEAIDRLMQPVPEDVYGGVNRNSREELAEFQRTGLEAISRGEVAVVLLAGELVMVFD